MQISSNTGQLGLESIRIGGVKIQELPIAESALAKSQMYLVESEAKQCAIKSVLKKYNLYDIPSLVNNIEQCDQNIKRFELAIGKERESKEECSIALALCKQRDKELLELGVKIA